MPTTVLPRRSNCTPEPCWRHSSARAGSLFSTSCRRPQPAKSSASNYARRVAANGTRRRRVRRGRIIDADQGILLFSRVVGYRRNLEVLLTFLYNSSARAPNQSLLQSLDRAPAAPGGTGVLFVARKRDETTVTTVIENRGDALAHLVAEAREFPIWSPERELELGLAWRRRGDEVALRELVGSHLRLVIKIARGFAGYGLPVADLVAE